MVLPCGSLLISVSFPLIDSESSCLWYLKGMLRNLPMCFTYILFILIFNDTFFRQNKNAVHLFVKQESQCVFKEAVAST